MAKQYLYSVYDKKVGSYDFPRAYASETMAHRAFVGAFRDPETNMLNEYPSDFSLVFIGVYDTETGKIDLDNTLVTSMEGTEAMHIANQIDKRRALPLQGFEGEVAKNLDPAQKQEAEKA